ncbi:MAG: Rod shape-determining protein RodA [Candidatus Uhrbacteria bacterium GW2011_GWD2_52_7]|uniref:Rod shape-determining protein RodA n=1 Tax=Candidatus Uhrbacteria bacterium GW2011_GWD2_52_7 TaxID=1618989 RepID=A0A0G1XAF6_9BACT|nr:MAG: Rod shape-determining protein RodA [Candidatus Uhrbacteria bacterium GW2011_GWD2_52_7]
MDWTLIIAAFVLFCFGMAAIFSVELSRGDGAVLIEKQLIACALGATALWFVAATNYHLLRNYANAIYVLALVSLIAVLLFGRTLNGSTGWFIIGGFAFQPVEFVKVALGVKLAHYFSERARRRFSWRDLILTGLITFAPIALLMLQPDLGGASILAGVWGVSVLIAGLRPGQFFALLSAVALAAFIGWTFVFAGYQKDRVMTFLNPALDPLETGYNVTQAKIAIGAGGLWGRGLGEGSQSQLRFLPESQTDFVFAVIAEELGFVGVIVVLTALTVLLLRMLWIARTTRDTFGAFLCVSAFAILFVEVTVHIGANLSLMPATGVALPFVSYGGSSLLLSLVLLGLVQSVAVRLAPGDRLS